jgi:hypothetical protein
MPAKMPAWKRKVPGLDSCARLSAKAGWIQAPVIGAVPHSPKGRFRSRDLQEHPFPDWPRSSTAKERENKAMVKTKKLEKSRDDWKGIALEYVHPISREDYLVVMLV